MRTHALTQTLPLMLLIFSQLNAGRFSFDLQAGFYFALLVVNRLAQMARVLTGQIKRKVLHIENGS